MTREEFNNLKPGEIVDDFYNGTYKIVAVNKMDGCETDIDAVDVLTGEAVNWLESDDIVNYIIK